MIPYTDAWALIRVTLQFLLNCYERACLFGKPAVVKETHIPQSAVHINCFIPPTPGHKHNQASEDSLTCLRHPSWCPSVYICALSVRPLPVSTSKSLVRNIYHPGISCSSQEATEQLFCKMRQPEKLFWEVICCEILAGETQTKLLKLKTKPNRR